MNSHCKRNDYIYWRIMLFGPQKCKAPKTKQIIYMNRKIIGYAGNPTRVFWCVTSRPSSQLNVLIVVSKHNQTKPNWPVTHSQQSRFFPVILFTHTHLFLTFIYINGSTIHCSVIVKYCKQCRRKIQTMHLTCK